MKITETVIGRHKLWTSCFKPFLIRFRRCFLMVGFFLKFGSSNAAKNVHFFEDKGLRCWNAGSSRNKGDKIYGASDLRCWTIGSYQRSRSKGNKYHGASHLKCSNAWSSRIKVLKWWESSHTFERLKRELPHFWAFKARAPILLAFEVKAPTLFGRLKRELPYFWAIKASASILLST